MPRASYLPAPENVVWEMSFQPGAAAGPAVAAMRAAGGAPAPAAPTRTYRILRTNESDEYDPPVALEELAGFEAVRAAAVVNERFSGTARKACKLSIADAPVERFNDLKKLIETLPKHDAMKHHQPPITVAATSGRVAEEKRNVRVTAFLYAASRENDNDYHLIIGRSRTAAPVYMTIEISGLPPSNSPAFARLKAARTAYKNFFPNLPGSGYDFYQPPVPVEVEGSLFWDASHATGSRPGPQQLRPKMPVVWEIHPVSEILFEP
jgi:hypothetical protein